MCGGRLRRTLENARDSAQSSAADLANATLSARSQLAIAYLQLRGADAQRKLLADTEVAYARTLTITENRYKAGTAARTDVLQAQTQLYSAQDQEQAEILTPRALENAIAALIGKPASGSHRRGYGELDHPEPDVPAGVPSELLLRRPDISVAERAMAAANAIIGVQEANYFPAITLTGFLRIRLDRRQHPFDKGSVTHSIAGSLSQTLLDFGGRRAQWTRHAMPTRPPCLLSADRADRLPGRRKRPGCGRYLQEGVRHPHQETPRPRI